MQHKSTEELTKAAIRSRICRKCSHRPHGSEALDPLTARSCEPVCTIFIALPQIVAAWQRQPDTEADELVQHFVCPTCKSSKSAGDFCPEHLARTCPLSCYASDVIETLEHMRHVTRKAS
jgi:hypothetical protein